MPKVFISYSHRDEAWKDKLLPHLEALVQAGMGMEVWQDREIDAGEKWHPAIQDAMADAVASVLLISADYLASSFCIKEEVPYLLDRQERAGMLLVPVLIRKCPWKAHRWLAARQMLPRDGKCVAIDFPGDHADGVFCEVAELVLAHLSTLASDPEAAAALPEAVRVLAAAQGSRRTAAKLELQEAPKWPVLPAARIDLTRLPETGAALFGRDQELQLLDSAWASAEVVGAARTRILAFTAHGGVGKSTLVNHWLREVQREHFRGASRVFGWSFYSQGARGQTASADAFIDAALRFFGDPDPAAGSPWDKGERLARRAGAERALLVLDGLEPLQSGHAFDRGKLRDPALHMLLRGLARQAAGLCVISTREPLSDFVGLTGVSACDLEQITPEAGRALLRTARVVGTDAELEGLAERFGPHALAVSLLGVYLYENDPRHGTGAARALEQLPGTQPLDRVLAGFEQWLAARVELEVLRLLGLFDRPADAGCLGALRAKPPIPGLTSSVVELSDAGWHRVVDRLEKLRLVHPESRDAGPPPIDAHPLLREHFATQLRDRQPEAWHEGHRRLYEHLKSSVPHRPEGLAALQPLYQAVAHGCKAGLHQQAFDEVYWDRISRGAEAYVARKVGAFGSDLGAVACFFAKPWKRLVPGLSEGYQAQLLGRAHFRLRALGRLIESLDPMRAALQIESRREDWTNAARASCNLSEVELTLGEMAAAVRDAEQSFELADRSGYVSLRVLSRTTLADVRHQSGARADALTLFRESEAMQAQGEPQYPVLYSLRGFQFCDLLLDDAERMAWATTLRCNPVATDRPKLEPQLDVLREVERRGEQALKTAEEGRSSLLTRALYRLTLGRVALYRAILNCSSLEPASEPLTAAVDGLRTASAQDFIPRGLLSRAWLRFVEGNPAGAKADLDEAWQIAERGAMKLHMADILLHRARLFHDKPALAKARKLIEQCGYWRRKEELEGAEAAAKSWPEESAAANLEQATIQLPIEEPKEKPMLPTQIPGKRRGLQRIAGCENTNRAMDIVFIHGLGGDSWTTWMEDQDEIATFWPNWAAHDFPQAGLWTLGYAADSSKWKQESMPLADRGTQVLDLLDNDGLGERPLVFITHSMGGIVAKQLLRHAESYGVDRWKKISRRIRGIAFIATPHAGAHIASFLEFASAVYRTNEHVTELAAHDSRLRDLHNWFRSFYTERRLICRTYCEKREVRPEIPLLGVKLPKGILVVDETSAEPNLPGEVAVPLDEDHISICKPASRSAQLYKSLSRWLTDCLETQSDPR